MVTVSNIGECPNKRWTDERRERLAAFHRKRHGAPDDFCTVHGIHVPVEHGDPVRYWANWIAHNHGKRAANDFILGLRAEAWGSMPRVRQAWLEKKQISENTKVIRRLDWEAHRANQNGR
jgi:hypothetical protein